MVLCFTWGREWSVSIPQIYGPGFQLIHPFLMRRTVEVSGADVTTLLDGLDSLTLTQEGDYTAFAACFLMREEKGVRGRAIYDRYRALGGSPNYIRC